VHPGHAKAEEEEIYEKQQKFNSTSYAKMTVFSLQLAAGSLLSPSGSHERKNQATKSASFGST
jgi:hypothetical protein